MSFAEPLQILTLDSIFSQFALHAPCQSEDDVEQEMNRCVEMKEYTEACRITDNSVFIL